MIFCVRSTIEVFESLKEAIRSKDALNAEVKELKNQKAVSDTEVARLKEELENDDVSQSIKT